MSDAEMEIFDDLHIVGWDGQAQVAEILHISPLKPG